MFVNVWISILLLSSLICCFENSFSDDIGNNEIPICLPEGVKVAAKVVPLSLNRRTSPKYNRKRNTLMRVGKNTSARCYYKFFYRLYHK